MLLPSTARLPRQLTYCSLRVTSDRQNNKLQAGTPDAKSKSGTRVLQKKFGKSWRRLKLEFVAGYWQNYQSPSSKLSNTCHDRLEPPSMIFLPLWSCKKCIVKDSQTVMRYIVYVIILASTTFKKLFFPVIHYLWCLFSFLFLIFFYVFRKGSNTKVFLLFDCVRFFTVPSGKIFLRL